MNKILLLLTILVALQPAEARSYRHYLDISRAEEILAGMANRPRLYRDQWLGILGAKRQSQYKIRRGDNLWTISAREFGNPFLWRKLWQENPFLTNPHDLPVGQLLSYYQESEGRQLAGELDTQQIVIRIPIVKLTPKGVSDLDNDSFVNVDIKNRFQPTLAVLEEEDIIGTITGSYAGAESIHPDDDLFISVWRGAPAKVGSEYQVVRFERVLSDTVKSSKPVLGNLMRIVGTIKVTELGEKYARAEVTQLSAPMHRKDGLIQVLEPVEPDVVLNPPAELSAQIVTGEESSREYFAQGEMVLLNRGQLDGVKNGFLFRAYRDTDGRTNKRDGVEPGFKGEVQIIFSGKKASVGYILRNKEPLIIGDNLIPTQAFPDPPPPPSRSLQTSVRK